MNFFLKVVIAFFFFFDYSDDAETNSEANAFERIRHTNDDGIEYWSARELAKVLEYAKWNNFVVVIKKAIEACEHSGVNASEHIAEAGNMIKTGNGAMRKVKDFALSRYACYLIVQNADPSKDVVALGQTYFAIQTRRQELADQSAQLTEDERRLAIRAELAQHNAQLADAAHDAGVVLPNDYAIFQNHGYKGLYGGLSARDIHKRKQLKSSQKILDHMGSEELAANLFRATQAEAKLRREKIQGKDNANLTHFEVGAKVRQTIEELGGTMPENLPTPDKSVKQLEREQQRRLDDGDE